MQQVLKNVKEQQEETLKDIPMFFLKIGSYHNHQRPEFIEKYNSKISDFEIYQSAGLRLENWEE